MLGLLRGAYTPLSPGGRLQPVLMRHPPSYLSKLGGGGGCRGGPTGGRGGGVKPGVRGGGGGLGGVAYKDRARPPPRAAFTTIFMTKLSPNIRPRACLRARAHAPMCVSLLQTGVSGNKKRAPRAPNTAPPQPPARASKARGATGQCSNRPQQPVGDGLGERLGGVGGGSYKTVAAAAGVGRCGWGPK